jgi:hypothetical protein
MTGLPTRSAEYLRFLAWVVAIAAAVALLGYVPTQRLGGDTALPALFAGCVIGLAASAVGGLPIALARGKTPVERLPVVMGSMLLRLVTAVALGAAAALSGRFARSSLLLWIVISYVALLVVDTRYALSAGKNLER